MSASRSKLGRAVVRPLLLVGFVMVQIYLIAFLRHDTLDREVWPSTNASPRIFGPRAIGQSFIPKLNNLFRVDLFTGTYGLVPSHDLIFRLFEGGLDGRIVAEVRVPGSKIRDNLFTPVEFAPVRKSREKPFAFVLSMPDASETEGPSIWMNRGDLLPGGSMIIDGRPTDGDCTFRTYSRRTILAEWERISHGLPGRWGNPFTLAAVALFFELALMAVFWRILGFFFEETDEEGADA